MTETSRQDDDNTSRQVDDNRSHGVARVGPGELTSGTEQRGAGTEQRGAGQLASGSSLEVSGTEQRASGSSLEVSGTAATDGVRQRVPLEQAWARAKLIRQLAMCDQTQKELAEEYGCARVTVTAFAKRHASEIRACRENLADEFADLWVASKRARLAEYQAAAEKLARNGDARSAEVLAKLLKDVAEELGSLPNKNQVNVAVANVTYEVVGVDPTLLT